MLLKAKFMSLLNNAAKKSYVVFFKAEDRKFLFTKEVLFEIKSDKVESLIKEFFEVDNLNENIIYKSNNLYSFDSYSIEKLKQGRTTLIIANRLSTIKNADNIVVLDKGRVVESGTNDELINLNGIYKKMYDTQIKG